MTVMTIRLPEEKHNRLKALAVQQKISLNKLIENLSTTLLAEHDAYARFQMRAARGNAARSLELLEILEEREAGKV